MVAARFDELVPAAAAAPICDMMSRDDDAFVRTGAGAQHGLSPDAETSLCFPTSPALTIFLANSGESPELFPTFTFHEQRTTINSASKIGILPPCATVHE